MSIETQTIKLPYLYIFCKMQQFSSNVFYVDNLNALNATILA